jgi:hypothetical protein
MLPKHCMIQEVERQLLLKKTDVFWLHDFDCSYQLRFDNAWSVYL